ncbi:MAG TPA: class I lanthipeptide [Hymenobacter sp.]|jgi:hypothetical protein
MKKKPIQLKRTLSLDKMTISRLDEGQAEEVLGGGAVGEEALANKAKPKDTDTNTCPAYTALTW